jgi:hypothetical protein
MHLNSYFSIPYAPGAAPGRRLACKLYVVLWFPPRIVPALFSALSALFGSPRDAPVEHCARRGCVACPANPRLERSGGHSGIAVLAAVKLHSAPRGSRRPASFNSIAAFCTKGIKRLISPGIGWLAGFRPRPPAAIASPAGSQRPAAGVRRRLVACRLVASRRVWSSVILLDAPH